MGVRRSAAGLSVLLMAGLSPVMAQEARSLLPGGASSLQETFENWRVACAVNGQARQCALSQEHRQQDGRRVFAISLAPTDTGGIRGILVLPFGLRLDAGIRLSVDGAPVGDGLLFSTCLPAGCVVPLDLDEAVVGAMRSGQTLELTATVEDSAEPLAFSAPLAGFGAGLERTMALLN